jgi:hypothetical protein
LPQILAATAARLDAKEVKEAAALLIQAMSKTAGLYASGPLSQGLAALATRLDPNQANEAAALLIQTMSKLTDRVAWKELPQGLAAVLTRETIGRREQRAASVTGSVGLGTFSSALPLPLVVLAPAMEALPEPLPPQMLVDLLKHPLCVGEARRAALNALAIRYQRAFADQWDFVRYAEAQKLGLDLISPPRRP